MDKRLTNAAFLLLAAALIVHAYFFWTLRELVSSGYPDFTSFYAAGETVRHGHGSLLYDPSEQWNTQQEFASRVRIRKGPLPYLRLPFHALLFVPFTLLPYSQAFALWDICNIGVVVAVALLMRRHMALLRQYPKWLPVLLAISFPPVFLALLQGQDSLLLLLAYTLAYLAVTKGADFRAGCYLGLGLFKPHLVFPFVLIALLEGKGMFVLGFASVCAVLLLVSVAVTGWPTLLHYPSYIWWLEGHTGRGLVLPRDTPNLRGLIEGSLAGLLPAWSVLLLIAVSSAAVLLWVCSNYRRQRHCGASPSPRSVALLFSQAMIATFLASYHAFTYDLSIFLLPIFLLAGYVSARNSGRAGLMRAASEDPMMLLLFIPIYVLLCVPFEPMNLAAIALLLWMWGLAHQTTRLQPCGALPA